MLRERDQARGSLIKTLEEKARSYEDQIDSETTRVAKQEALSVQMKTENEQLKRDLSWLAN